MDTGILASREGQYHGKNTMASENLTQDEIDLIATQWQNDQALIVINPSDVVRKKYRTVLSEIERLNYARENRSFVEQRGAERALHHATFALWLANRGLTKDDYCNIMNRELKKRGSPYRLKINR